MKHAPRPKVAEAVAAEAVVAGTVAAANAGNRYRFKSKLISVNIYITE